MRQIIKQLEHQLEERTKELNSQERIYNSGKCRKDMLHIYRDAITVNREFISECTQAISLLKSENTEGVSTSPDESGVSHGVSDRNASRSDSAEASEEVVGGTLALRTEAKEFKYCDCYEPDLKRGTNLCLRCGYHIDF